MHRLGSTFMYRHHLGLLKIELKQRDIYYSSSSKILIHLLGRLSLNFLHLKGLAVCDYLLEVTISCVEDHCDFINTKVIETPGNDIQKMVVSNHLFLHCGCTILLDLHFLGFCIICTHSSILTTYNIVPCHITTLVLSISSHAVFTE